MFEVIITLIIVVLLIRPIGAYVAHVMQGGMTHLHKVFSPVEQGAYRLMGISASDEMNWKDYAVNMLIFSFCCFMLVYTILISQGFLPFNPQNLPGVPADLAFNIAMSFTTDTNWQDYDPETTLSHFSQFAGLAVQGFLGVGVGIAVAVALARGIRRKQTDRIGNFWSDVLRAILYILLPLACLWAIMLVSQGVVQHFGDYVSMTSLEGEGYTIAMGPAASQVAIKQVGANGGGFFATNSAHPFENPNPITNVMQMVAILLLPASFLYAFGIMVGDRRQGIMLLATAFLLFLPLAGLAMYEEGKRAPLLPDEISENGIGNLEGKETRIGSVSSAFWAAASTTTGNGSVNSSFDSMRPLGALVPLMLTQMSAGKFGGIGIGLCCMIIYVVIAVFLGGLMAGRTPEFLNKKLSTYDIKIAALFILIPPFFTLMGSAIAVSTEVGQAGIGGYGAQGFTELLYAFSTAAGNNGSSFGGLNTRSTFYDTLLGICIFAGRFFLLVPVLALAGSLAKKNTVPTTIATLPTHTPLFCLMLIFTVFIVDVMTYIPVLALGPIVEHLHMIVFVEYSLPVVGKGG